MERLHGRLLLPVVALVIAAGCSATDDRTADTGALSRPELGWIRDVETWELTVYRRLEEALAIRDQGEQRLAYGSADAEEIARYKRALREFLDCSESLGRELREPPSTRLERTLAALVRACRQLEKAAREDARAIEEEDPYTMIEHRTEWNAVFILLNEANAEFGRFMKDAQPLPARSGRTGESHVDPVLSRVASAVAGFEGEVRCWSRSDWEALVAEMKAASPERVDDLGGFISFDLSRINLPPDVCRNLTRLAGSQVPSGGEARLALAEAVMILAHESMHLARFFDEAEAQCYALQNVVRTARALGADRADATTLARVAWRDIYPFTAAEYRSRDCRNDGPLDLNRGRDAWP